MKDTFFTTETCDRCQGGFSNGGRIMSWFNDDTLCEACKKKENELRESLRAKGIDTDKLEGCGYIPKE